MSDETYPVMFATLSRARCLGWSPRLMDADVFDGAYFALHGQDVAVIPLDVYQQTITRLAEREESAALNALASIAQSLGMAWSEPEDVAGAVKGLIESRAEPASTRMAGWVVELEREPGCWLTDGDGDPPRTCVISNANVYASHSDAHDALDAARRYRRLANARIVSVAAPVLPDPLAVAAEYERLPPPDERVDDELPAYEPATPPRYPR